MDSPIYGLDWRPILFEDENVDEFSESSPQGGLVPLTGAGPTSRARRGLSSTGGVDSLPSVSIHIIHRAYCYYDSYLFFNKILESNS